MGVTDNLIQRGFNVHWNMVAVQKLLKCNPTISSHICLGVFWPKKIFEVNIHVEKPGKKFGTKSQC